MAAERGASEQLTRLGVGRILDHDRQSFSELLGGQDSSGMDAVLDCVGIEMQNGEVLREQNGAAYASLASPALCKLETEGALAVVRSAWQQRGSEVAEEDQSVWLADTAAAAALAEVLTLIEEGKVDPPLEANPVKEMWDQYMEFVNWARDTETGLRYGFPGPSMWPADEELKW